MYACLLGTFLLCHPARSLSQGIDFDDSLSWTDIKAKAKAEHKLIFIDCYASWCGPCKMMERDVYPDAKVGAAVNAGFISVKVQFDRTEKDDARTKRWYEDADSINTQYGIGAFPSLLILSPDAQPIKKEVGYKSPAAFIAFVESAKDPKSQYWSMAQKYKDGGLSEDELFHLMDQANAFGDRPLATEVATAIKTRYIDGVTGDACLTKKYLLFYNSNPGLFHFSDPMTRVFIDRADTIDKTYRKGLSYDIISGQVDRVIIQPSLWRDGKPVTATPDWGHLRKVIADSTRGDWAVRMDYLARLDFYKRVKNWAAFVDTREQVLRAFPPKPTGGRDGDLTALNADAWSVFEACDNPALLKKALAWSDRVVTEGAKIDIIADCMDTRANLLYKLGRKKEAVQYEEQSIAAEEKARGEKLKADDDMMKNLEKMKQGEPTWK